MNELYNDYFFCNDKLKNGYGFNYQNIYNEYYMGCPKKYRCCCIEQRRSCHYKPTCMCVLIGFAVLTLITCC